MQKVVVIGLGYVGLPLAVQAAHKGYDVAGIDVREDIVAQVNDRRSPFVTDKRLKRSLLALPPERLKAGTSYDAVKHADVVIVCVPTPTEDNTPNLTYVRQAAQRIAACLRRGQLVILESTVNPGITREEILPILERDSGLQCGVDFNLAHCPERIDPGNVKFHVGNLNRVIGGITTACTQRSSAFYRSVIDAEIIELGSCEEAEFVKSWENSHRNVMIALANEAAAICDTLNMSIDNVLVGLQSKVDQFGLKLARPGIGPGGHCIPEDIHYIIKKARQNGLDTRLLDSAAELNDDMPRYAVGQLQRMAGGAKAFSKLRVALLGLAYKENVGDARRSPAVEVAHLLVRRAGDVAVHDPFVSSGSVHITGATFAASLEEAVSQADAVFVATAHSEYLKVLTPSFLAEHGVRWVFDGRNCLDRTAFSESAVMYKGVGRQ